MTTHQRMYQGMHRIIQQQLHKSSPSITRNSTKSLCKTISTISKQVQHQQLQSKTTTRMLRQMSRTAIGVEGSLQIAMSTQSIWESSLPRGWDLGVEGQDDDGG